MQTNEKPRHHDTTIVSIETPSNKWNASHPHGFGGIKLCRMSSTVQYSVEEYRMYIGGDSKRQYEHSKNIFKCTLVALCVLFGISGWILCFLSVLCAVHGAINIRNYLSSRWRICDARCCLFNLHFLCAQQSWHGKRRCDKISPDGLPHATTYYTTNKSNRWRNERVWSVWERERTGEWQMTKSTYFRVYFLLNFGQKPNKCTPQSNQWTHNQIRNAQSSVSAWLLRLLVCVCHRYKWFHVVQMQSCVWSCDQSAGMQSACVLRIQGTIWYSYSIGRFATRADESSLQMRRISEDSFNPSTRTWSVSYFTHQSDFRKKKKCVLLRMWTAPECNAWSGVHWTVNDNFFVCLLFSELMQIAQYTKSLVPDTKCRRKYACDDALQ